MIIPDFSAGRVLVVGDVMLDRYWHGVTSRISPEAPVPVVHVREIEERPGGAGNVALNIAALGAKAELFGITGSDEPAESLRRHLESASVRCRFHQEAAFPTVTKLRVISLHQQLIRLDFEQGFHDLNPDLVLKGLRPRCPGAGALVLSDYGKGVLAQPQPFIAAARDAGLPILVDPKQDDFSHYRGATLITPNRKEFESVVGECRTPEELVEKGLSLIESRELGGLLITRGEEGMTLLTPGKEPVHLPTQAREVFDVTGAGDTVIAVMAAGLALGLDMKVAMRMANVAAGVVVGKLGTATLTAAELQAACDRHEEISWGVMDQAKLVEAVERARAAGETIVMTNGVFDILHAGHVRYLRQAASLGDRLIVAVNDDASVRRLKGETRPVNPLDQRMEVLAGLSPVDWVVPFSEDTPRRLICEVAPDCLVKGGDYRIEEVAGHECAEITRILPFVDGCSTTSVIDQIRKNGGET
ncbi:MAG: bifunctional D-glycero-beta-D-manno-heptose-7-phosphate kinase/D-glycero-beta-D-manno-heptose 1-phosphate adenylyltransferase HldE [Gammaproteobacteria bacterium]|jgi:D-beta-D-heptose 7-phosphate kinase/D-beta-D-heptose 1-phosphate adenosyltransferase|nr:bifunctional D-glycero-beta-D-manno-heptose-7-phosphate kinase/D-glycero-beta-D-manno-heptose 1-phosphate adenylyltransferase HldE [Gammaproteobacteria bacterium]